MTEVILPEVQWGSDLEEHKEVPKEARVLIERIVNGHNNNTEVTVTATPELIRLAKEYLSDGISVGSKKFNIMVCEKEDSKKEENAVENNFFVLVPKWKGRNLKMLSEY
ncbi:MAG: hypothetical protein WC878_01220 [Candidatus Paceibacterota bacterium]|jgi:hypothetical protein